MSPKMKTVEEVEFTFTGKEYKWNDIDVESLTKQNLNTLLQKSFNFYNYHKSNMVKKFVVEYIKSIDSAIDFSSVPDEYVPKPLAWYCRMITHCGFKPTKDIIDYIHKEITTLSREYSKCAKQEDIQVSTVVEDKQEEIVNEINFILGKFDAKIDEYIISGCTKPFNFKSFVAENEVKSRQISRIKEYVEKMHNEIKSALNGEDKDLVEGYSNFSKPQKKKLIAFLEEIMNVKSYEKKNTKAKKQEKKNLIEKTNEIKSDISDAKEVWVLSKNYNCIIQYVSEIGKSISLNGKTLINVDRSRSTCKRVSSKVIEQLINNIKSATYTKLDTLLSKFEGKIFPVATRFDASKPDIYKLIRVV